MVKWYVVALAGVLIACAGFGLVVHGVEQGYTASPVNETAYSEYNESELRSVAGPGVAEDDELPPVSHFDNLNSEQQGEVEEMVNGTPSADESGLMADADDSEMIVVDGEAGEGQLIEQVFYTASEPLRNVGLIAILSGVVAIIYAFHLRDLRRLQDEIQELRDELDTS